MKKDHIIDLLPQYLDDQLEGSQKRAVEKHLAVCSLCNTEKEELQILLKAFEEELPVAPSGRLRTAFEKMLEKEKQKSLEEKKVVPINRERKSRFLQNFLKIAAVITLLLGSYFLGKFHQGENPPNPVTNISVGEEEQQEMLALLNNTSASMRIKGVNSLEKLPNLDEDIIAALRDRMLTDENNNVRLTAVEALGNWTNHEVVKESLITALKTEKDPVIQITIIQILVQIQEKKAVEPMKNLLKNKETEAFVKEQINALLPSIT